MNLGVEVFSYCVRRTGLAAVAMCCLFLPTYVLAGPAPDWVLDIEPGTWAAVGFNTLSDVDPEDDPDANPNYPNNAPWRGGSGQRSVLDKWNGGAFASGYGSHGALMAAGGGHKGYFGSEVYAFDLGTRLWTRVTDPYPNPDTSITYSDGRYPDGSPLPSHTYDMVDYHPGTNSFVLMRGDRQLTTASSGLPYFYLLDLDTAQWRISKKAGDMTFHTGGISCFDRDRDVIWILSPHSTGKLSRYNVAANTWSHFRRDNIEIDGAADCPPGRDVMLYTQFKSGGTDIWLRDLNSPDADRVRVTQSGATPNRVDRHGWEWSDMRKSLIYVHQDSGGDVHEFYLDGSDPSRGTWYKLTSPANTVVPQQMQETTGMYSRFRLAKFDNAEVGLVTMRVDGPVYAFRIPDPADRDTVPPVPPDNVNLR